MNAEKARGGAPGQSSRLTPASDTDQPVRPNLSRPHCNTEVRYLRRFRTRTRLRTSDFLIRVACIFACLVGISAAIRGAISAPHADGSYFLVAIAGAFALVLLHFVWGRS